MSDRILTTGDPVPDDGSHTKLRADGQQQGYVCLTPAELAKGFVQPVRESYTHTVCDGKTTMARLLAETYARDPHFYSGTFCCHCCAHFPLKQFVWYGTSESLDPGHWTDEKFQQVVEAEKRLKEQAP